MRKKIDREKAIMAAGLLSSLSKVLDLPDLAFEIITDNFPLNIDNDEIELIIASGNSINSCREFANEAEQADFEIAKAKMNISTVQFCSEIDKELFLYSLVEYAIQNYDEEYITEVWDECRAKKSS